MKTYEQSSKNSIAASMYKFCCTEKCDTSLLKKNQTERHLTPSSSWIFQCPSEKNRAASHLDDTQTKNNPWGIQKKRKRANKYIGNSTSTG